MRASLWAAVLMGVLSGAPIPLSAQTLAPSAPLPFRILDQERLFQGSQLGQRILEDLRQAQQALEAENQQIFDQLAAEERALTEQRASLSPEEFRALADAFDARVTEIRAEREARAQELFAQTEAETQRFFDRALPILGQMMADEGVAALLRPETVILGVDALDITDRAIAAMDANQP